MKTAKLRPCKCGGTPRLGRVGDQKVFFVYQCSECYYVPVKYYEARRTEFGARLLWNRYRKKEDSK